MPKIGDTLAVTIQLFDGDVSKFVKAVVRNAAGSELSGSPKNLPHVSEGRYEDSSFVMPNTAYVTVSYSVFNDAAFTSLSAEHSFTEDILPLDVPAQEILDCLEEIKETLNQIQSVGITVKLLDTVIGLVEDAEALIGVVAEDTITAVVAEDALSAIVDEDSSTDNDIVGVVEDPAGEEITGIVED